MENKSIMARIVARDEEPREQVISGEHSFVKLEGRVENPDVCSNLTCSQILLPWSLF